MKILITGGSGFIGLNLYEKLNKEYAVLAPSRSELDLLNADNVKKYLKEHGFDKVIHCATWDATKHSNKDTAKVLENNVRMFLNIIHERDNFGQLINLGSGAEYSREHWIPKIKEDYFDQHIPTDQYGLSKYIISKYIENTPNAVNLRLFGVFGKCEDWRIRFISNAIYNALNDLPITIKQDVFFDYLYIDDLCNIISSFLHIAPKHKVYNVCTSKTYCLSVLAQMVLDSLKKELPIKISQKGLGREYSGDNSRLCSEIKDIHFTPMRKSIESLCLWYKENKAC